MDERGFCLCATASELQAALADRGLPPDTGLPALIDHVFRQGAQVAALEPDSRIRRRLVDTHLAAVQPDTATGSR